MADALTMRTKRGGDDGGGIRVTKSHGSHVFFFVFFLFLLPLLIIPRRCYITGGGISIVCLQSQRPRLLLVVFLFCIFILRLRFIDFRYVRMPRGRDSVSVSFPNFYFYKIVFEFPAGERISRSNWIPFSSDSLVDSTFTYLLCAVLLLVPRFIERVIRHGIDIKLQSTHTT